MNTTRQIRLGEKSCTNWRGRLDASCCSNSSYCSNSSCCSNWGCRSSCRSSCCSSCCSSSGCRSNLIGCSLIRVRRLKLDVPNAGRLYYHSRRLKMKSLRPMLSVYQLQLFRSCSTISNKNILRINVRKIDFRLITEWKRSPWCITQHKCRWEIPWLCWIDIVRWIEWICFRMQFYTISIRVDCFERLIDAFIFASDWNESIILFSTETMKYWHKIFVFNPSWCGMCSKLLFFRNPVHWMQTMSNTYSASYHLWMWGWELFNKNIFRFTHRHLLHASTLIRTSMRANAKTSYTPLFRSQRCDLRFLFVLIFIINQK